MIRVRKTFSAHDFAIDVAPLVDVLFTLLIFFSLTSSFKQESGIKVNLPEASASGAVEHIRRIEIVIPPTGAIRVGDRDMPLEEVAAHLGKIDTAERQGYIVVIKGDADASHGRVTTVLDTVRGLGFKNVAIATRSRR